MPIVYEDTNVLRTELYKIISDSLDKHESKFRSNIAKFMNDRHQVLYDIAPYDRIYFNQTDVDNLFNSLGLKEKEINQINQKCFWGGNVPVNPQCVKEPYVVTLLMCIRYYLKNNKRKFAELTTIYLAFSGKFYASLHSASFPKFPPSKNKTVMDYVINNMLTDKFDLKREGTVFGAIRSMCITWLDTYEDVIIGDDSSDYDYKDIIQQLRDREKSFLKNIANLYYTANQNKNYLNYETDNLDQDSFRLTDNDAATATRITENAMNYLTSNYVSLDICNKCKDSNVKATEIKDIMESILGDNNNLPALRRIINIMICDFMRNYPGVKVGSIEFVAYTIKAKPNTKDPLLIEVKETILSWLDENSPTYRKRKSRKATAISYYKSIVLYLCLVINRVAK